MTGMENGHYIISFGYSAFGVFSDHISMSHCLFYRCEPFDTYPRTYDLLHAAGLFSVEQKRYKLCILVCGNLSDILPILRHRAIGIFTFWSTDVTFQPSCLR